MMAGEVGVGERGLASGGCGGGEMPGGFDIDIQLFNYSDKIYPAVWQKKGMHPDCASTSLS